MPPRAVTFAPLGARGLVVWDEQGAKDPRESWVPALADANTYRPLQWQLLIRDGERGLMPLCWLAPPTVHGGVLVACECRPPAVVTTSNAQRWPAAG